MPQLVASAAVTYFTGAAGATAATFAGAAAASAATGAIYAAAYIGATAAIIGGTTAYSSSQSAKLRRSLGTASLDQGRTVMVRDPLAARRLIYGQEPVSGSIVFFHTTGAKNEYLHLVVMIAGHEVEEIGDIYFNNELVPLASNIPVGKYAAVARINKKRGVAGDTADADLIAETGGVWTSAHTLSGCAYLAVRLKWSADLFPNGIPTIKALVKGKKVYDPRTTLTAWSANAALCAADFLTDSTWGKGVALSRLRTADLIEAANLCDEDVVLADASTEKRYTVNGTVLSSQDPASVLLDLAGAMAGHIVDTGGTWTVRAGAYRAPTVTLTDDDLMGAFAMQPRQSRLDTFNRVRGVYISPDNQWAAADFPAVQNATYKVKDGGLWLDRDVQYNFTTSSATAQRLAKIELERGRQQITVSALYSLKAMQLMPGDTVAITRARLGWTDKEFEVVEWAFKQTGDGENLGLGIEVSLRETASGVWDWADGEETTVDLAPNTTLPDPFTVGTPSLTLLTDSTTATIQPDGTVQPRLRVSWATPNNIHVESGGVVELEYKKTTDSDYTVWTAVRGDALFDFILDVKVGVQYNVRARFRNNAGVRGAYGSATSSAVVGDTTTPNAATSIAATARAGFIDLHWTPSTSGTVNEYFIYRSIVSALAGFSLLAQTANSQYQDSAVSAGTTYWYYVVAQSVSGNDSPPTTVVNAAAIFSPSGAVPANPTAPAQPGSPVIGTYDATDGSAFAFVTLDIAAMPSGAVWQNLLYRRTGAGDWMVAAQFKNTGATQIRLDDLSPGIGYDIATQAWNGAGGSAVVTGTAFTAPSKTAAVAGSFSAIAIVTPSSGGMGAYYFGANPAYGAVAKFTCPADRDLVAVEVKAVSTNDSTSTSYTWYRPGSSGGGMERIAASPGETMSLEMLANAPAAGFMFVRAINSSAVTGAWTSIGNLNTYIQVTGGAAGAMGVGTGAGTVAAGNDTRITGAAQNADNLSALASPSAARGNLGLGTVATQEADDVTVTGLTIGGGVSSRKVVCLMVANEVFNLSGGTYFENENFSITNHGFSAKPDVGFCVVVDPPGDLDVIYDWTHASNSSTNVVLTFISRDHSTAISAGNRRVQIMLAEYD